MSQPGIESVTSCSPEQTLYRLSYSCHSMKVHATHYWISAIRWAGLMFIRWAYRNDPKFSDTQNICCNHSKVWTMWLYRRLMSPNDADGMANSADPDQTAPLGAVWTGSALFAQAYLSENLGSLRYSVFSPCSPREIIKINLLPRH